MKWIVVLDMLCGYVLICIMLDYMLIGVLCNVMLVNFIVFDVVEFFVLLLGFLVGMVWVKIEVRYGWGVV